MVQSTGPVDAPLPAAAAPVVVEAAPVVAAPEATPPAAVAAPEATPPAAEPLAQASAPAAEALSAPSGDAPSAAEPSLVEGEAKAEEPKAEEPKAEEPKAEEPKAEPEKPSDNPEPEPLKFADFKFPEGVKVAPEQLAQFTDLLNKVDPRTQDGAQALLDLHTKALQDTVAAIHQQGQDAFQTMRRDWRENYYKQAGNRADSMANDAKWAIQELFPKTDERKAFVELLGVTGAGDNYAMVSALSRVARRLKERGAPASPTPAKQQPMSREQRRYNRPST